MHERIWFKSSVKDSNKRLVIQTFSWRVMGPIDTIIWLDNHMQPTFRSKNWWGSEVPTKMLLYFAPKKN